MTEAPSTKPSFNIPKIRRQSSKDNLRTVDLKSRDAQEVCNVIERSYLDGQRKCWQVRSIQMVDNKELESQYRMKRQCMKEDGRHSRELQEHYAFLMVPPQTTPKIAQEGLKVNNVPTFNSLGNSKLAVVVCRHADIQLKVAESKVLQTCCLMVFKVTQGRCKPMTVLASSANVEPTPNYDCHVSQERAMPNEALNAQIPKAMVYMYEYNDDCETVERPRHCLPYAVIHYTRTTDTTGTAAVKQRYGNTGYTAKSYQSGKSLSKDEVRSNFQQKMAEKIQRRMQQEAEMLQRSGFPLHPGMEQVPSHMLSQQHFRLYPQMPQRTTIIRAGTDPRLLRDQQTQNVGGFTPEPVSAVKEPSLSAPTFSTSPEEGERTPTNDNEVFEDPYSPTTPEALSETDTASDLQAQIDDDIIKMIDQTKLRTKLKQAEKYTSQKETAETADSGTITSKEESGNSQREETPTTKTIISDTKQVGDNNVDSNGSTPGNQITTRVTVSEDKISEPGSPKMVPPPKEMVLPPVESVPKMVPPPTKESLESVLGKLSQSIKMISKNAVPPLATGTPAKMASQAHIVPPHSAVHASNTGIAPTFQQPPLHSHYQHISHSGMVRPPLEDVDERVYSHQHMNPIVNEMGDVDLRTIPQKDLHSSYQFGHPPYGLPSSIPSITPEPTYQENRPAVGHAVGHVGIPLGLKLKNRLKDEADSDSSATEASSTDSPSKGKLSLAAYKARKRTSAPHLRLRVANLQHCASDSDSVSASDDEGRDFKSPVGSISPRISPRRGSAHISPDRTRLYGHYNTEDMAHNMGIKPHMHKPHLATFQPTVQYDNLRAENQSGNTPDSAKSANFNLLGGSFLDNVNLDISNLKSILQNIAVSPTTSPKKESVSESEDILSSFKDAPWNNVEPVKRQLSEEEAHAAERYDAYNMFTTGSGTDSAVDKTEDSDYDALVAKIKNLRQEIDKIKKSEGEGKSPRSSSVDISAIQWPSPLKDIVSLQKTESKQEEKPVEKVGANLLEDLSFFEAASEAPRVKIPGLGFGEGQESPQKDKINKAGGEANRLVQNKREHIRGKEDTVIGITEEQRKKVNGNRVADSESEECITIDDEDEGDESMIRLEIITDEEMENEDETQSDEKNTALDTSFQSTADKPIPLQSKNNILVDSSVKPQTVSDHSTKGDVNKKNVTSTPEPMAIPFKGFYRDILSSDVEDVSTPQVSLKRNDVIHNSTDGQSTSIVLGKSVQNVPATVPVLTLGDEDLESSVVKTTDDVLKKSPKTKDQGESEKQEKAKLKQKMKKNKEMLGYRSRRRRRKKKEQDPNEMESIGSELSSEYSGFDKSSTGNLSGRGSPILDSPEKTENLKFLTLADYGLIHWKEAVSSNIFQPVVKLKRLPEQWNVKDIVVTAEDAQAKTVPFDTEDALPKQARVQAWIEGTTSRKKIKLTLKTQTKPPEDPNASKIPVLCHNLDNADLSSTNNSVKVSPITTISSAPKVAATVPETQIPQTVVMSTSPKPIDTITSSQRVPSVCESSQAVENKVTPTTVTATVTATPSTYHLPCPAIYQQPRNLSQSRTVPLPFYQSMHRGNQQMYNTPVVPQAGYYQRPQAVHALPVRPAFVARPPPPFVQQPSMPPVMPPAVEVPVTQTHVSGTQAYVTGVPLTQTHVQGISNTQAHVPGTQTHIARNQPPVQGVPVSPAHSQAMAGTEAHFSRIPVTHAQVPVLPQTQVLSQPVGPHFPYQSMHPTTPAATTTQFQTSSQGVLPTNSTWAAPVSTPVTQTQHTPPVTLTPYTQPAHPQYASQTPVYPKNLPSNLVPDHTQPQSLPKPSEPARKRSSSDVMDWFADKLAPKRRSTPEHYSVTKERDSPIPRSPSTGSRTPDTPRRADDLWDLVYTKSQSTTAKSDKLEQNNRKTSVSKTSVPEVHQGSLDDRIDLYRSKIFSDGPEKIGNESLSHSIKSIMVHNSGDPDQSNTVSDLEEQSEANLNTSKSASEKEMILPTSKANLSKSSRTDIKEHVTVENRIDTSILAKPNSKEQRKEVCKSGDVHTAAEQSGVPDSKPCGGKFKSTFVEVKESTSPASPPVSKVQGGLQFKGAPKQRIKQEAEVIECIDNEIELIEQEDSSAEVISTAEKALETIESLSREKEMLERKLAELAKISPARHAKTKPIQSDDFIEISEDELEEGEIVDESDEENAAANNTGKARVKPKDDTRVVISLDSGEESENDENNSAQKQKLSVTVHSTGRKDENQRRIEVYRKADKRKVVAESSSERKVEKVMKKATHDDAASDQRQNRDLREELSSGSRDERVVHERKSSRDYSGSGHRSRKDEYYRDSRPQSRSRHRSRSTDKWRSNSRERKRSSSRERGEHRKDRSKSGDRGKSPVNRSRSQERRRNRSRSSERRMNMSRSIEGKRSQYRSQSGDMSLPSESVEGGSLKKDHRESFSSGTLNAEPPDETIISVKTAMKPAYDEWRQLLQKEEKRIEQTRTKKQQPTASFEEELQTYTANRNKPTQTVREWLMEEYGNIDISILEEEMHFDMDLDIFTLSKNQRKTLRNRIRKEIERFLPVNTGVRGASSGAQGDQRMVVMEPGPSHQSDTLLKVTPFQELPFPKSKISEELSLIRSHLKLLWVKTQTYIDGESQVQTQAGERWSAKALFSVRQDLQQIETDLQQRFNNFDNVVGVPHRRVPNELLSKKEMSSHMSEEDLVLILCGAIPSKPYNRLLRMKEEIQELKNRLQVAKDHRNIEQVRKLEGECATLHQARKAIMLTFTGPLSKKRQNKLKMKLKVYRNCMDYFVHELQETVDVKLGFLKTALMDMERHYAIITYLLGEVDQSTHKDVLKQMSQSIEDKKQRAVVEKLKNDLTLVDNKLSMMYHQYENNEAIRFAIEDVLGRIKEALQLIKREEQSERMHPESVTKLRDILQYSLNGYTQVKQQIGKAVTEGTVKESQSTEGYTVCEDSVSDD